MYSTTYSNEASTLQPYALLETITKLKEQINNPLPIDFSKRRQTTIFDFIPEELEDILNGTYNLKMVEYYDTKRKKIKKITNINV